MSSFTEDLYVRKIGIRKWEVTRAFDYHVGKEDSREVVTIPKGFITDFASSPRITWIFFPPDGRYTQAAVLHDYLIKTKQYSRVKTNKVFLEAMEVLGVPRYKRLIMYWCVQAWTYVFWNSYTSMAIILCLLLTGCASLYIKRDEKGNVIEMHQKGLGKFAVDKDGAVNTELAPNWYPKDVVNLYKD